VNASRSRRLLGLLAATGTATALLAAAPAHATTLAPAVRTVGHSSSGKTLTLVQGRKLKIDLRTAVDGGYRWVTTHRPNKAKVEIVKRTVKAYPHRTGVVGFPYHTVYLLQAHGTGTTRITLVERQGTSKHPAERFTLRVHVVARS
jgi:predicted secreted protein